MSHIERSDGMIGQFDELELGELILKKYIHYVIGTFLWMGSHQVHEILQNDLK